MFWTKKVLVSVFSLVALFANAQKNSGDGFVILSSGDTLLGRISLKANFSNFRECHFRSGESTDVKVFHPDELLAYRIGDTKYYLSKEVVVDGQRRRLFLECLVDGVLDLYYLQVNGLDKFFLEGADGSLLELENEKSKIERTDRFGVDRWYERESNRYRMILTSTFKDSPETVKKIQNTDLTYKDLINITEDYHESTCDWECMVFAREKLGKMFFEPFFGYRTTKHRLVTSETKGNEQSARFGLNLRFNPAKNHLWTWSLGLSYSAYEFNETYEHEIFNYDAMTRLQVSYGAIGIPISLEHTMIVNDLAPIASIGFEPMYLAGAKYDAFSVDFNAEIQDQLKRVRLGGFIGLGLKKKLGNNYAKAVVQYAVQYSGANTGYLLDSYYHNEWRVMFSMGFQRKKGD